MWFPYVNWESGREDDDDDDDDDEDDDEEEGGGRRQEEGGGGGRKEEEGRREEEGEGEGAEEEVPMGVSFLLQSFLILSFFVARLVGGRNPLVPPTPHPQAHVVPTSSFPKVSAKGFE